MSEQVMNYPRCKTCKWWADPGELPEGGNHETHRFCDNPKLQDVYHGEPDGLFLSVWETPQRRVVAPGPDFGCIHHEPKEASNGDV